MLVVNAEGANTFYELTNGLFGGQKLTWNSGRPNVSLIKDYYEEKDKEGVKPHTKATAIQIGKPANLIKALRSIDFTNGIVMQVSDKEMSDGMALVGLNGFDCEMASGAVPAGIRKLRQQEIIKKDDVVVGILTGKQKDPKLSIDYHLNHDNTFSKPPVAKQECLKILYLWTTKNNPSDYKIHLRKCKIQEKKWGSNRLSGGLDSSVCLVLAAKALDKNRIMGLIMPERGFTPQIDIDNAFELAEKLKIRHKEIHFEGVKNPAKKLANRQTLCRKSFSQAANGSTISLCRHRKSAGVGNLR